MHNLGLDVVGINHISLQTTHNNIAAAINSSFPQ